jgi:phage baseplate assembly protein W
MPGLGSSPLGSSGLGTGSIVEAPERPDPPQGANWIDVQTRDYQVDSLTGELKRMPVTRQRVYLALRTRRGSSAVLREFGTKIPGKIDQFFEQRVINEVRRALADLIDEGAIILQDITVNTTLKRGLALILVDYIDMETGKTDQANL